MARRISSRSGTGSAPLDLGSTFLVLPRDLDLPERLGLGELDLPFTVKLEEGQETHNDMDPSLAVRHQIAEPSGPDLFELPPHVPDGLRHRRPDGRHVREIDGRRR